MRNMGSWVAHQRKTGYRSTSTKYVADWMEQAACIGHDPDLWFPEWPRPNTYHKARRICQGCPVRRECLTESLERGDHYGMFGGLTPGEREKLVHHKPPLVAA